MIIEIIFSAIFSILNGIVSLISIVLPIDSYDPSVFSFFGKALNFFPSSLLIACFTSIVFWMSLHMIWAIIEWVYKKFPGVS